ncbi:MAG: preprotein translocase subunit YajC [Gammaproteobacteria bacterium]|jgi:preprotein translocase subunit YajC|nr:preprotein translocase subunit YajC [Gammaproteobacteria bacterium]
MSFLIAEVHAQTAPAPVPGAQVGAGWEGLLFPIGLLVVLYFFMIRPQIKRQKEHKKMVDALKKGDEVQTAGGLMGKVKDLDDNFATVEIAQGVDVKIRRASVEMVMPKGTL